LDASKLKISFTSCREIVAKDFPHLQIAMIDPSESETSLSIKIADSKPNTRPASAISTMYSTKGTSLGKSTEKVDAATGMKDEKPQRPSTARSNVSRGTKSTRQQVLNSRPYSAKNTTLRSHFL
jgi:hypothetical protein